MFDRAQRELLFQGLYSQRYQVLQQSCRKITKNRKLFWRPA